MLEIDLDGNVKLSSEVIKPQALATDPAEGAIDNDWDLDGQKDFSADNQDEQVPQESPPVDESWDFQAVESNSESDADAAAADADWQANFAPEEAGEDQATSLLDANSNRVLEKENAFAQEEPAVQDNADFAEVVDFANSEKSNPNQGELFYSLVIQGVDSAKIREELRVALEDKAFLWDVDEIFSSMKDGVLRIEKTNPVKASILVERLKAIDVQVQWKQYHITDL